MCLRHTTEGQTAEQNSDLRYSRARAPPLHGLTGLMIARQEGKTLANRESGLSKKADYCMTVAYFTFFRGSPESCFIA